LFLRGAFPHACDRLRLDVAADGHLGDGSTFADGALLLLLAEMERQPPDTARPGRKAR
jgi:hypothetical protein